jgi:hypothetical protein
MKIRYVGTWDDPAYPHRLELVDLQDQLHRSGLPAIQQVAYRTSGELCLKFKSPPPEGEELPIQAEPVRVAWLNLPDRHPTLDAKLVFEGLEEALDKCGYEVRSSVRAGGPGTPIAMRVKFATTPSAPEWSRGHVETLEEIRLPEEVPSGTTYSEGSVERVLVNRYERDPRARQECIRYYGTKCFLCGFDFAAQYGGVMAGFIHVHHLASLASVGEDYEVDPVEDLRPVCPNCHAVLHRKEPPYSLEDVRRFLEQ